MASTSDFKNGMCIEFNNDLFMIVSFMHVKPGKGPAFVRTKLKSVTTGKVLDNTFNSGVKVNTARIERRPHQFLYKAEEGYYFMHNETFEQVVIEETKIDNFDLFKEGQLVEIVYHADTETPLYVELPPFVIMEVTYTEPGLRGDTASSTALKAATVETGATVKVPLFVEIGDRIKVDTAEKKYVERVKA
ncbi:MAG: hypothetical protein RIS47_2311 [Bacteroidota bacterium]|jgi:elongation factor P